MSQPNDSKPKLNIAYNISKFFLENTRTAILALTLVIVAGVGSLMSLGLSGFPGASINLVIVNTVYPGASSETMVKEVTQPIEKAVKNFEEVDSINSTSGDSFSTVSVSLKPDTDLDKMLNDIQTEVDSINLPEDAQDPNIFSPEVGGPDLTVAIAGDDLSQVYKVYKQFSDDASQIPEIFSVEPQLDLQQKVTVTLDQDKIEEENIDVSQINTQLATIGESLPAVSDAKVNSEKQNLTTTFTEIDDLEEIKNLEVVSTPAQAIAPTGQGFGQPAEQVEPLEPKVFKLEDLADIGVEYFFTNEQGKILDNRKTDYAYHKDGTGRVLPAVILDIKASKGADLVKMEEKIEEEINDYEAVEYATYKNVDEKVDSQVLFIKGYSVNEDNQQQVDEVVNGLLAGIILVFVLMLIFVSWRAAILASIGIPLSLTFTTIYLLIIGEDLNTLVLFSLVLVIGLVVDPALVILESVQRKKDLGLSNKEAALAAMQDVGPGLLSSTLTNLIVFLPLAIVSGTLGQIFGYIPMTIMPALVGSYVVAVVFLSWLGSGILKKNKKAAPSEEDNLWPIARWFIAANEWLLNVKGKQSQWLSLTIRIALITIALIVPMTVTGALFGSGALKQVQFASDPNSPYLLLSGTYLNSLPQDERETARKEVLETVANNEAVYGVVRISEMNYYVLLRDMEQRGEYSDDDSAAVAKDINQKVQDQFGDKFFDVSVDVISNGPPAGGYQINLAVKSDDLEILKNASEEMARQVEDKVCQKTKTLLNGSITEISTEIDQECTDGEEDAGFLGLKWNIKAEKIVIETDDGYTDRETKEVSIFLDRTKLLENQLYLPNAPLSALVNQQVADYYDSSAREVAGKVELGDTETEIILTEETDNPDTLEKVKDLEITSLTGETFKLEDIAEVKETSPKSSITRLDGETVNQVRVRLNEANANDQGLAAEIGNLIVEYYANNDSEKTKQLGLEEGGIEIYSEGGTAEFNKTFTELGIALFLAVFLIYFLLVVFFKSFTMPLTIMFTIPLTFLGAFPALAAFVGSEFGFLETIGLIILVGLVVNVAIYLIDLADQKVEEGWEQKKAVAFASGVRLRPIFLTNITAIASLAPLFFTSDFYKSIATVIMFGLTSSAITSLFTTPILYIFFKWLSGKYHQTAMLNKVLFVLLPFVGMALPLVASETENAWLGIFQILLLTPFIYIITWAVRDFKKNQKDKPKKKSEVEAEA